MLRNEYLQPMYDVDKKTGRYAHVCMNELWISLCLQLRTLNIFRHTEKDVLQSRISKRDVVLKSLVIGDILTTLKVKGFKQSTLSKWIHVKTFQNRITAKWDYINL